MKENLYLEKLNGCYFCYTTKKGEPYYSKKLKTKNLVSMDPVILRPVSMLCEIARSFETTVKTLTDGKEVIGAKFSTYGFDVVCITKKDKLLSYIEIPDIGKMYFDIKKTEAAVKLIKTVAKNMLSLIQMAQ